MPGGQQRGRAAVAKAGKKRERTEKQQDDYESDGGFVEDGASAGGPKSKKRRTKADPAKEEKGEEYMWEVCDRFPIPTLMLIQRYSYQKNAVLR